MAARSRDSLHLDMSSLDTAAMQTAIFTKVEGVAYSSVMITGNMRQAIEGVLAVVSRQLGSLRRPGICAALRVAFGIGAAVGAYTQRSLSRTSYLACPWRHC